MNRAITIALTPAAIQHIFRLVTTEIQSLTTRANNHRINGEEFKAGLVWDEAARLIELRRTIEHAWQSSEGKSDLSAT